MSSHYGIVFPEFWSGETGRAIRAEGGKDGQLVALYLMSAPNATMIGLFPLPLRDLRHDTGIGQKALARAFQVLGALGFADYDGRTEHVWVREMAKFRLGLQKRSPLDADDKRVTGIQRLYDKLTENPFLEPFFDRYAKELRLRGKRRSGRLVEHIQDIALQRGFEGASKPVNRDQEVRTEIREQRSGIRVQGSGKAPPRSRRSTPTGKNTQPEPEAMTHGTAGTPDVQAGVCDRDGTTQSRPDDRRRGMEGQDARTVGPIGFRGPGSADAGPGDVGGRTRDRENTRPTPGTGSDIEPQSATSNDDGRAAQSPRSEPRPRGPDSHGTAGLDSHYRRSERADIGRSQSHTGTNPGVAPGARGGDTGAGSGVASLDQNTDRLGETPGQAELRRTIERLKRGRQS